MKRLPDVFTMETRIHGTINGNDFEFVGTERGETYKGIVEAELNSTTGPVNAVHLVGGPIGSVGYPNFCQTQPGCFDAFKASVGYEYERHFRFDDGGYLDTLHRIEQTSEDALVGDFHVSGEVTPPEIVGIEPLIEIWLPDGPGRIRGQFVVSWKKKDGNLFTARVDTEYRLNHEKALPRMQFRHVEFQTNHTEFSIRQRERVTLFRDFFEIEQLSFATRMEPLHTEQLIPV